MLLRFRSAVFAWGALAALATVPLTEQPASACGGCFRPQQVVSAVNAHRMVFSVSPTQSILWDQFSYSGDPQDFAWVLPVRAANVKVELAHDEFISALDAWTSPIIRGPQNSGGGGFGCGASVAYAPGDNGTGVQVINQEVVGPYEVATLRSTDPTALDNWLTQHGYDIPPSIQPTIAAYVSEGFDFIALRLQPGQGVASMQPVRVVTQGADPTLPLRMVAAGIGSDVGILLFVISEGRYEAANFNNTEVDFSKLQWNPNLSESNYNDLIQQAMASGDGRNFTVEFAGHLDGRDSINGAFKSAYYSGVTSSKTCPYTNIHGTDFGVDFADGGVDGGVDDASIDASDDASTDGGAVSDGGTSSDGGTLAQPYDPCSYDDLTAATAGMNPSDVFVTRLRADLPATALSQDLTIQAAADQSPYSNVHDATQTGDGCSASGGAQDRGVVVMALGALAALAISRRRKRA